MSVLIDGLNLDTSLGVVSLLNILSKKGRKKKDTLIEMPLMGTEKERTMYYYTAVSLRVLID